MNNLTGKIKSTSTSFVLPKLQIFNSKVKCGSGLLDCYYLLFLEIVQYNARNIALYFSIFHIKIEGMLETIDTYMNRPKKKNNNQKNQRFWNVQMDDNTTLKDTDVGLSHMLDTKNLPITMYLWLRWIILLKEIYLKLYSESWSILL